MIERTQALRLLDDRVFETLRRWGPMTTGELAIEALYGQAGPVRGCLRRLRKAGRVDYVEPPSVARGYLWFVLPDEEAG